MCESIRVNRGREWNAFTELRRHAHAHGTVAHQNALHEGLVGALAAVLLAQLLAEQHELERRVLRDPELLAERACANEANEWSERATLCHIKQYARMF